MSELPQAEKSNQFLDLSSQSCDNLSTSPQKNPTFSPPLKNEYVSYKSRFLMLSIVVLLNISNSIMWISFSPIACKTRVFYQVSSNSVNLLSLLFMICYPPLGFLSSYVLDSYGLVVGVGFCGAFLNLFGAWLRYLSVFASHDFRWPLLVIGQAFAAFAQPFILNSPTKLAASWFGEKERTTANMIGTMSNPIGVAISMVLSPSIVTTDSNLPTLLLIHAIIATAAILYSTLLRNSPPTPPTHSASSSSIPFWRGLSQIFRSKDYILLLIGFGLGLGVVNAFSTLLGQIAQPQGYSDSESGIMGALFLGAGMLGAAICAPLIDYCKKYNLFLKSSFFLAAAMILWLNFAMRPGKLIQIYFACFFLGTAAFIVLPTALELGVESTYPVAEGTSAGFLWMAGNLFGIVCIEVATLLKAPEKGVDPSLEVCSENAGGDMSNSLWFLFACTALGCFFILLFNTEYHRLKSENGVKVDNFPLEVQFEQNADEVNSTNSLGLNSGKSGHEERI
eukprot:Sdes_comp19430_c0_seq1m10804